VQKFGTQAQKAISVELYCNGDVNAAPKALLIGKAINTWDKFLTEATKIVKLSTGACKKVYKVEKGTDGNVHTKIASLVDLEDGGVYLACGAEEISKEKYPKKLEDQPVA